MGQRQRWLASQKPPDPPHVEDKGDDADRKPDRRPCAGRCSEHRRKDREHDIAEQASEPGNQDRSAEDPVCRSLVGRRRTFGDAKKTAHREVCGRWSGLGGSRARRGRGLAHRFEVTASKPASPAAPTPGEPRCRPDQSL